jgi:uncharacterized protein YqjF (DUF2071 family)
MNRLHEKVAAVDDTPSERVSLAVMLQSWCDLTFLHWRFPAQSVQAHVPAPLEVESFDGSAWVGVTPFVVRDLRPPLLPALPWISAFPETNCRTYVRGPDGQSGVWFFSLDAARSAAVAAARISYGLPYAWARMKVIRRPGQIIYESSRRWPDRNARTRIIVEPGEPIRAQPLDIFLTARFRLYSFLFGRLTYTRVEHPPWPLQSARFASAEQTLTDCAGLPNSDGNPLVHFSPGVRVRVAAPAPVPG